LLLLQTSRIFHV